MSEPESRGTMNPVKPTFGGTGILIADAAAELPAMAPGKPAREAAKDSEEDRLLPPAYFREALLDAESLLKYAAESGIDVDQDTRDHILHARRAVNAGWNEEITASLLAALTKLTARLKPITAASLNACSIDMRHTVRNYWAVAVCLAIVIVPFSMASFVASAMANTMRTEINTANELAVRLRAQLGASGAAAQRPNSTVSPDDPAVITELQQYATAIRAIDARARQLNSLILNSEKDPFEASRHDAAKLHDEFQLPPGLPDLASAAENRTAVYQDVRYFAQSVLDAVSFYFGAITACLLPVLYALLGTCAYLLRTFEQQMDTKTFTPSVGNSARFLIAAIGGAVVGLFNNFTIGQGASIPPLALAFLVGYAVDVFFAFLEGLLQAFTKK